MKILWTLMTGALAISFAGCASTSAANRQPTAEEYQTLIDQLKEQNTQLRQQAGHRSVPVDPAIESQSDAGSSARVMIRPEDMVPPPAQRHRMPPQNWAWLHQPPAGCESGVLSMEVENQTDFHAQILLDGEELRVRGARGVLPGIPPHEVVYLCLNNIGQHTFTGMLFALRYGQPQKVGRYRLDGNWDGSSTWTGRQKAEVRELYITWEH